MGKRMREKTMGKGERRGEEGCRKKEGGRMLGGGGVNLLFFFIVYKFIFTQYLNLND